jgi:Outer membrane protein beta-barrel domain
VNRVNRRRRIAPLLSLGFLLMAAAAAAQTPGPAAPAPAAAEEPLPRRDAFFYIGWRGATFDSNYFSGFEWDARLAYGATGGYYLTPNLKLEADVSGTSPSRFTEYTERPVEGQTYPSFYPSEHRAVTASFRGLVIYQFFENASFHPFLGAGAGVITTRERVFTPRQVQTFSRGPNSPPTPIVIVEERTENRTDHATRGLVIAGFKAYPGERWFFRTDVQWTPGVGLNRDITWRLGAGLDF